MLAVGAATVGITMHLVNAQGNLKLLADLDLQKKPEITEENILPETPPKPASQEASEPSVNEETQMQIPQVATPAAPSTTGTEATKSQDSNSSEATDLIKFIQIKAKEIHDSN